MTTKSKSSRFERQMMTTPQQIAALQIFGYDDCEARFLCIAALQSGYFLRRQYLTFIDGAKGSKDIALLNKLKGHQHCRVLIFRHSRMVYHLSAKPIYDSLGEKDNRNRREHQPITIKNRIMALDFVLANPDHRYLATEREKRDYFTRERQIAPEDLPIRWYESPRGVPASAKYFADKYPIFIADRPEGKDQMHFCYVDEGTQDIDRFTTYLRQYSRLFAALGDFRVIYVAQHDRLFAKAHHVFDELCKPAKHLNAASGPLSQELLDYFEMRREYEAKDFSRFDTARLIRYREAKNRFAGADYEGLYSRWLEAGNAVFVSNRDAGHDPKEAR